VPDGTFGKRLLEIIRRGHEYTALIEMFRRCLECRPQVVLGQHIVDGVVNDYGLEFPSQLDRTHIPDMMFDPGIELARAVEHFIRQVHGRCLEIIGQMREIVPTPGLL